MGDVKKIGKYFVREVIPDFLRCDYCGFTYAISDCNTVKEAFEHNDPDLEFYKPEEGMHRLFHLDLNKLKDKYGSENIFVYSEMIDFAKDMFKILPTLSKYDFNYGNVNKEWRQVFRKLLVLFESITVIDDSKESKESYKELMNLKDVIVKLLNQKDTFENNMEFARLLHKFSYSLYGFYINYLEGIKGFEEFENCISLCDSMQHVYQKQINNKRYVDEFLRNLIKFEFSRSHRLYDYNNRNHASFEDYYVLLWNTPRFINIVSEYLTENQLSYYVLRNMANRLLLVTNIDTSPFYFGSVIPKKVDGECIDLSHLDQLVTSIEYDVDDYPDNISTEDYKFDILEWLEREKEIESLPVIKKFN